MRTQGGEAAITPLSPRGEASGSRRFAPLGKDAGDVVVAVDLRTRGRCLQAAIKAGVPRAIVGDAAGRVELDRLERSHERPAQPESESVLDRLVEILGRDDSLAHQAERL